MSPSPLIIFSGFFFTQNILFPPSLPPLPPSARLLFIGESFQPKFERYTYADFFAISQKECALFCKFMQRSQLIANYWPLFAEVIECWRFYWMCCLILLMNLMCSFFQLADHLQLKTLQLLCILFYRIK